MGNLTPSDRGDHSDDRLQGDNRNTFVQYLALFGLSAIATVVIGITAWSYGVKDGFEIGFDAAEAVNAG